MDLFDCDDGWTTLHIGTLADEVYLTMKNIDNVSMFINKAQIEELRDYLTKILED